MKCLSTIQPDEQHFNISLNTGSGGSQEFTPAKAGGWQEMGVRSPVGKILGGGNGKSGQYPRLKILRTEEPGGQSPWGLKESDTT